MNMDSNSIKSTLSMNATNAPYSRCPCCFDLESYICDRTDPRNIFVDDFSATFTVREEWLWPNPLLEEVEKSAVKGCPGCSILFEAVTSLGHSQHSDVRTIRLDGNPGKDLGFKIYDKDYTYGKRFRIYTTPDTFCPWPVIPPGQHFTDDASSDICLGNLQTWVKEADHAFYPPVSSLPTRVLGLKGNQIRLVETFSAADRYTTLSHCWGTDTGTQPLRTTQDSIETFKIGIPWEELGKTFQDAIRITRALGVDYIWVDSLCIIQDDPLDWEREASRMAETYSNSYLSIINAHGFNADSGCFGHRFAQWDDPPPPQLGDYHTISRVAENGIPFNVFAAPRIEHYPPLSGRVDSDDIQLPKKHLFTRGWVMQEYVLAPRVIIFGLTEMIFLTPRGRACECSGFIESMGPEVGPYCFESGDPMFMYRNYFTPEQYFTLDKTALRQKLSKSSVEEISEIRERVWRHLITAYTRCNFTDEMDRLVALCGLARRFQSSPLMLDDNVNQYVAGLWIGSLFGDLTWFCGENTWKGAKGTPITSSNLTSQPSRSRPAEYRAPSWSWASVVGAVNFYPSEYIEATARIIETTSEPSGYDPMGNLKGGSLVIIGRIREVTYSIGNGTGTLRLMDADNGPRNRVKDPDSQKIDTFPVLLLDFEPSDSKLDSCIVEGQQLFCFWLFRGWGGQSQKIDVSLVLRKVGARDEYCRVGLWLVPYGDRTGYWIEHDKDPISEGYFRGCEQKKVTII